MHSFNFRQTDLIFLVLLLCLVCTLYVPPAAEADEDTGSRVLDAPWTLLSAQNTQATGEALSQPNDTPTGGMHALVPGTVLGSYVQDGKYPEPYFDLNNKLSAGLIPDASVPGSVFTYAHWYRTTFTLGPKTAGKTLWLDFNGINYKADIFLNGHAVGKMVGMFKRGMFNVTDAARAGKNALAVKIHPLDVPGIPHTSGCGGDGKIGLNPATMYATIGWDFTIIDGVRDRNMGIYRSVQVTTTGPVRIRDPFMVTDNIPIPGKSDTARLHFQTSLINAANQTVTGKLTVLLYSPDGRVTSAEQSVTLAANETREVTLLPTDHPGLVISNPLLWWPVNEGQPNLYRMYVFFKIGSQPASDIVSADIGIRTITRDLWHGQNRFWVNGRRTFISGGNWVQDAMLRATPKSYEAQLRDLADAGVNLLRCWSASAPESDTFFDLCDKYGIMVWVESGAAAQVATTPDVQTQLDNWADVLLRVRNHPSVAYYCGGNEGWPVKGTAEVTAQVDPTRGYQDSSQENGQRGCPYRYIGTNTLYDYTARDEYGAGPLGPMAGFCNETGTPALPPAEVLRAMIAPENLWPTVNNPGFVDAMDYHDGGGFHQMRNFINNGCAEFGAFNTPDLGGRVGLENYAFKGQILGAMDFRAMGEVWKRNKWDTSHKRYDTGYCLWTINSANPMAAARLVNYTGEPNAALFYYAHANKPLHVQYDYFYNDATVINDTDTPIAGLNVRAEVRSLDWTLKWSGEKTVSIGPDKSLESVLTLPAKDTPGFDPVHFIVVTLTDAHGKLIDSALYWRSADGPKYGADGPFDALNFMPMARLKIHTESTITKGQQFVTVTLTNPTKALAFFTRLKIDRTHSRTLVQPCHYTDNYFSLAPGESQTVTLDFDTADLHGEHPQLVVEGWNLKTGRFGVSASGETPFGITPHPTGLALLHLLSAGHPVTVSSTEATGNVAANAVDGDMNTRWASVEGADPQWLTVDLGAVHPINAVKLNWEDAAAKDYQIQVSDDNAHWTTVKAVTGNTSSDPVTFLGLHAHGRYVRVYGTARVTQWGYSLYEVQVFGK